MPKLAAELGYDAAELLSQFTGGGKRLTAHIEQRERPQHSKKGAAAQPILHLMLHEPDKTAAADSINAQMLAAGVARLKTRGARVCDTC